MEEKRDFLGKRLEVGDPVVFMQIGYRGLMRGVISKLGPKKATISHEPTNTHQTRSIQFYEQIIKA